MRALDLMGVFLLVACASRVTPPRATAQDGGDQNGLPTLDPSPSDQAPSDQSPSGRAPSDEVPPDQAPSDQVPPDQVPSAEPLPESSPNGLTAPAPEPPRGGATADETRQCRARGGTIQPVCMLGELACVVRYRDGGKRCSDKRDCTGECLYDGPGPAPLTGFGTCQRTSDPCGCKAPIHHGRVQPALCID